MQSCKNPNIFENNFQRLLEMTTSKVEGGQERHHALRAALTVDYFAQVLNLHPTAPFPSPGI